MASLPDPKALRMQLAQREAARAAEEARKTEAATAEHQAWVDALKADHVPDGAIERLNRRIAIAIEAGQHEIELLRFPNEITTDRGRAINQAEPGWERSLTGIPKVAYEYWAKHLRDHGYHLRAEVVSFPNGIPGDCALYLGWQE
jgi:hypothetical protein